MYSILINRSENRKNLYNEENEEVVRKEKEEKMDRYSLFESSIFWYDVRIDIFP